MQKVTQVVVPKFGGPEVLRFDEVELASPPPSGHVLLNVEWIGLNQTDFFFREGTFVKPELPTQLGSECSGVIAEVAGDVTGFAAGDRVSVIPAAFDVMSYGVYGETILMPATALIATPEKLAGEQSAAFWMAYITAWGGLIDTGQLETGWHVVIPAASSSLGVAAIQVCRLKGAIPIAVTTKADKADRLKDIGAKHVIISTEQDVAEQIMAITSGKGAELFFDMVGGAFLMKELACAAPGATVVLAGMLDNSPTVLETPMVVGKTIKGYSIAQTTGDRQQLWHVINQLLEGIETGVLNPVVDRVFDFVDIQNAHRYMHEGRHTGKIVVKV